MVTSAMPNGALKDIAIGIAVTLFIFTLALNLPVVGFFIAAFIPLPIVFFRAKRDRRTSVRIAAVAAIAMAAALGRLNLDTFFYFELLILGFVLGEALFMNLTIEKTIIYGVGAVIGSSGALLILYGLSSEHGIVSLISDYVLQSLKLTLAIYEKIGISEEAIHLISDSMEQIQYVLVRILPALTIGAALFVTWINLLTARSFLLSKGLYFPEFGKLNRWKAPDILVWGVIFFGILLLFPSRGMKVIGLNGLIVFMVIYFLEGMGIVSYFFEKKRFPRFLRMAMYAFIFMQQLACLLVIGLGFFDTWLNFRKVGLPPTESE